MDFSSFGLGRVRDPNVVGQMSVAFGGGLSGRWGMRLGLGVASILCLVSFASDGTFPIGWGLFLLVACWGGWESYFMLPRHSPSLLLVHILFFLTYPVYLAHLVVDPLHTLLLVPFDKAGYTALLILAIAGYLGVIAGQLLYVLIADRSRHPSFSRVAIAIATCRIWPIVVVSVVLYLISIAVIYKTGIGVIGYNARPDTRYVYGFTARLAHVVVPMINLFTLELLLAKRSAWATPFIGLVLLEALGLTFVSLSRFALLSYVGLPALLFAITPFRKHISGKQLARVAGFMGIVVLFGVSLAEGARAVVYSSLIRGAGYERALEVDSESFKVGVSLGTFFFFERLSGARELSWVDEAITAPRLSDIWYTLVTGPPASDPAYINRSVLGMTEEINEDTGFGSGLTLLANFRFGGGTMTVFLGMMGMTAFFLWLEVVMFRLVGSRSLVLFIMATIVINLWQGLALLTVFQRPFQMCMIGVLMIFVVARVTSSSAASAPRFRKSYAE